MRITGIDLQRGDIILEVYYTTLEGEPLDISDMVEAGQFFPGLVVDLQASDDMRGIHRVTFLTSVGEKQSLNFNAKDQVKVIR